MKLKTVLSLAFVLVAVLSLGCAKRTEPTTAPEVTDPNALYRVYIIGIPMVRPDFQTTGRFDMAVLAIRNNENIFWLDSTNLTLSTSNAAYTLTRDSIRQVIPLQGKIAVNCIFDGSGSMSGNDPSRLRVPAGKAFVAKLAMKVPASRVAVAEFASQAGLDYYYYLWRDFTTVTDTNTLFPGFDALTEDGSSTPLYTSIRRGLEHTDSTVANADFSRSILAFTDGWDNASYTQDSVGAIIANSRSRGIPVYAIGLGSDVNEVDLARMASYSGGVYAAANDASQLLGIFTIMAVGMAQGYNVVTAHFNQIPPAGTTLSFIVRARDGDRTVSGLVEYVIPQQTKGAPARHND